MYSWIRQLKSCGPRRDNNKTEMMVKVILESKSKAGHISSWQGYPYQQQVQGGPCVAFAAVLFFHTLL